MAVEISEIAHIVKSLGHKLDVTLPGLGGFALRRRRTLENPCLGGSEGMRVKKKPKEVEVEAGGGRGGLRRTRRWRLKDK